MNLPFEVWLDLIVAYQSVHWIYEVFTVSNMIIKIVFRSLSKNFANKWKQLLKGKIVLVICGFCIQYFFKSCILLACWIICIFYLQHGSAGERNMDKKGFGCICAANCDLNNKRFLKLVLIGCFRNPSSLCPLTFPTRRVESSPGALL